MGDEAAASLADRVTGDLPDGIAALSAEHQRTLADAIDSARRRQGQELAEAAEHGLRYVPKVLRRSVSRVVNR